MSDIIYIMDTSYLLELNEIPGKFDSQRTHGVKQEINEIISNRHAVIVTIPILLEYASHLSRIDDGNKRRQEAIQMEEDITSSLARRSPWNIPHIESDTLPNDIIKEIITISKKFSGKEGFDYSFADLSIIVIANELRAIRTVKILTFDKKLKSHSSPHNKKSHK